jgi:hypothetical protein
MAAKIAWLRSEARQGEVYSVCGVTVPACRHYVLLGLITQVLRILVCQCYPILKPRGKKCRNIHGNVICGYQMTETYEEMLLKLSEVNSLAPRKKYYSV